MLTEHCLCLLLPSTLLTMWWVSLLLLVLASSRAAHGSECLVKTLKCSRLRPTLNTHKGLFVSRTQMNEMCRQQDRFFKCLDHMVATMETDKVSLPPSLLNARTLIKDMCLNASSWQTKYFEVAPCINRQYTEFCTSPEFLGTVRLGDKPRSKCSLREEAVNCIATTLAMNCGLDAGKLFRQLLGMTSDGGKNCFSVGPEVLFFPPAQESTDENTEAYNEVYSGLVKRIGGIPEQDESVENYRLVAEDKDVILDMVSDSPEEFASPAQTSKGTSMPFGDPHTTTEFDASAQNASMYEIYDRLKQFNFEHSIRFHGNDSISEYMRNPYFDYVEFVYCHRRFEKGKKVFVCVHMLRDIVPICLEGGRVRRPVEDPINPEDIDPFLGARLYIMFPYSYPFKTYEEMSDRMFKHFRESRKKYSPTTTDESVRTTDAAIGNTDDLYTRIYDEYTKDSNVNDARNSEGYSSTSSKEHLDGDRLRDYVMAITTARPQSIVETVEDLTETTTISNVKLDGRDFDPKSLTGEYKRMYALLDEVNWLVLQQVVVPPSRVKFLHNQFLFVTIDRRDNSPLVNMTCGRVNECHPNATHVHKCHYYFTNAEDPKEEVDAGSYRTTPTDEPSGYKEMKYFTDYETPSSTEEVFDRLEKAEPVEIFDESHNQHLDLPVTEGKYKSSRQDNLEEAEISEEPETESVQLILLEPHGMPSEQTLKEVTEGIIDNDHNSSEYSILILEDEHPASDSSVNGVGENLGEDFDIIRSLNDLEDMIAGGLENIQLE